MNQSYKYIRLATFSEKDLLAKDTSKLSHLKFETGVALVMVYMPADCDAQTIGDFLTGYFFGSNVVILSTDNALASCENYDSTKQVRSFQSMLVFDDIDQRISIQSFSSKIFSNVQIQVIDNGDESTSSALQRVESIINNQIYQKLDFTHNRADTFCLLFSTSKNYGLGTSSLALNKLYNYELHIIGGATSWLRTSLPERAFDFIYYKNSFLLNNSIAIFCKLKEGLAFSVFLTDAANYTDFKFKISSATIGYMQSIYKVKTKQLSTFTTKLKKFFSSQSPQTLLLEYFNLTDKQELNSYLPLAVTENSPEEEETNPTAIIGFLEDGSAIMATNNFLNREKTCYLLAMSDIRYRTEKAWDRYIRNKIPIIGGMLFDCISRTILDPTLYDDYNLWTDHPVGGLLCNSEMFGITRNTRSIGVMFYDISTQPWINDIFLKELNKEQLSIIKQQEKIVNDLKIYEALDKE